MKYPTPDFGQPPHDSQNPAPARYSVALDVGGTFTDVTLVELGSRSLWTTKTPTTPADPSLGFLAGIEKALRLAGARPEELTFVFHGTTTATNAILEDKGVKTALLTTRGFKYVLEIGRHDIPRRANMYAWQKPARPVPPELVFEIPERLTLDGEVLEPLHEAAVRAAARQLRAQGVESAAICFIHSYANPAHERAARDRLLEEHPDCTVSLSSEVLPVFREYERSMATVLNAYVQPLVGRYVGRLEHQMRERGIHAPFRIMKSNGGVISAEVVRRQPIYTALSGPAAGVIGARLVGRLAGFDDVISVDVGGTSADICVIRGGEAEVTNEGRVGAWPLHVPMIDIHTIGAGGGSIAAATADGSLAVGPASAGAVPGPACYGAGGEAPTVTDANLVLGRIPPYLLGGEMPLDVERARRAIMERVAGPLGLTLEAAANGILDVVNNNMVGAIRLVSIERGYDPREFALVPFGGAGPLHGGQLADLLDMRTIVVPRSPGVLSTFGLLATDVKNDYARTSLQAPPNYNYAEMEAVYAGLERQARAWFEQEGVPSDNRGLRRLADLRYRHQGFEITVPFDDPRPTSGDGGGAGASTTGLGPPAPTRVDADSVRRLIERFHRRHEQLYTHCAEDAPVEIVTLRVSATGGLRQLTLPPLKATRGGTEAALIGARRVYFAEAGGYVDCPRYDRERLAVDATVAGPAIVEQLDSTTVVLPGQTARVDQIGNLIISR